MMRKVIISTTWRLTTCLLIASLFSGCPAPQSMQPIIQVSSSPSVAPPVNNNPQPVPSANPSDTSDALTLKGKVNWPEGFQVSESFIEVYDPRGVYYAFVKTKEDSTFELPFFPTGVRVLLTLQSPSHDLMKVFVEREEGDTQSVEISPLTTAIALVLQAAQQQNLDVYKAALTSYTRTDIQDIFQPLSTKLTPLLSQSEPLKNSELIALTSEVLNALKAKSSELQPLPETLRILPYVDLPSPLIEQKKYQERPFIPAQAISLMVNQFLDIGILGLKQENINWKVLNTSIAELNQQTLKGLQPGTTLFSAEFEKQVFGGSLVVIPQANLRLLEVFPASLIILSKDIGLQLVTVGQTVDEQLVHVKPEWAIEGEIVSIYSGGFLKAKNAGITTVTAKQDNATRSFQVVVD